MNKIIDDMDMEKYHDEGSISSTNLSEMAKSCCGNADYKKKNRHEIKQSTAMFEGTLIHHALQTRNIGSAYSIAPVCDGRTTHGRALKTDHKKECEDRNLSSITKAQYDMANGAMDSAWSQPESRIFLENGLMERSGFTNLMGVDVKARPDIDCTRIAHSEHFPALVDIKTRSAGEARKDKWRKDFKKYHTYLQAGLQILIWRELGYEVTEYYYLLVEREAPYPVNVIPLGKDWIHYSILLTHHYLDKWKTYLGNGLPKGYGKQSPLEMEDWEQRIFNKILNV